MLANVDADLVARVAAGLGMPAPDGDRAGRRASPARRCPSSGGSWPADGRVIGLLTGPGFVTWSTWQPFSTPSTMRA